MLWAYRATNFRKKIGGVIAYRKPLSGIVADHVFISMNGVEHADMGKGEGKRAQIERSGYVPPRTGFSLLGDVQVTNAVYKQCQDADLEGYRCSRLYVWAEARTGQTGM
jgi:hypothetical protein